MEVIICLAVTTLAVVILRKPIERAPWLFYLAASALSLAFGTGTIARASYDAYLMLVPVMRRCELAFSLLAIVMFAGVLPRGSKMRAMLSPIRGNLAIIAALLAACHVVLYASSYLAKVGVAFSGLNAATYAALAFAVVLVALFGMLTVTSVRAIRNHMQPGTWNKLQKLAYAFFPLIGVHALLMIGPAALAGGRSTANAVAYLAIVALYVVLRLARAHLDSRHRGTEAS